MSTNADAVPKELEKIPALFEHCKKAYAAMLEESAEEEVAEGLILPVYEGFLTKLFTERLFLSLPYYTHCMKRLKAMDCVRQLRRGGSSTPSKWALLKAPVLEEFSKFGNSITPSSNAARQQIRDLSDRISKLEDMITEATSDD